ncbi:MAG TPA: helix-turn-helix transcriptional regulator [Armatimonadota bacterium]|jgi:hypothetical protein
MRKTRPCTEQDLTEGQLELYRELPDRLQAKYLLEMPPIALDPQQPARRARARERLTAHVGVLDALLVATQAQRDATSKALAALEPEHCRVPDIRLALSLPKVTGLAVRHYTPPTALGPRASTSPICDGAQMARCLAEAMRRADLTPSQLHERTGVAASTISRYLAGHTTIPHVATIAKLAEGLGVTLDVLLPSGRQEERKAA